jgi:hypothetical protein
MGKPLKGAEKRRIKAKKRGCILLLLGKNAAF